jgi:hypothetical protein
MIWLLKDMFYWFIKVLTLVLLNRDSDKMIFERLQKEFEAARASQTGGNFDVLHLDLVNAFALSCFG